MSSAQEPMVLVVDDDPAFLEQARKLLTGERHVFLATDARQGFALAEKLGFTVVLVDLDLEGEDGFSLIERLHSSFPNLPIVAISGVAQGEVLESAKVVGAIEVLPKPITPEWKKVVDHFRSVRAEASTQSGS